MIARFDLAVVVYAVLVLLGCVIAAAGNRLRGPLLTASLVAVEIVVVAQALLDIAEVLTGHGHPELATHLGYLAVSVVALPAAAGAVHMDPGRWGSIALAVGCFVIAVVSIRLQQTLGVVRA